MDGGNVPTPVREIQKRAAKVNTQLRFAKLGEALQAAYDLRLHIQTCGFDHPLVEVELESVEAAIVALERRRFGFHRHLAQLFLKSVYDAFRGKTPQREEQDQSMFEAPVPAPPTGEVQAPARPADSEDLPPGAPRM